MLSRSKRADVKMAACAALAAIKVWGKDMASVASGKMRRIRWHCVLELTSNFFAVIFLIS